MRIRFKHQQFQADAAKATCDVFAGQPYLTASYVKDAGDMALVQREFGDEELFTGFGNAKIVPHLTDDKILENIQNIQRSFQINPSSKLEGRYNLTIEMETGVGKTYTYIKTIYELNERYGWSKFIVVVPSVAIREGVYKSFQITEDHFTEQYNKKIRSFIYNSSQLTEIDRFASDSSINVMIINSQAFNARGKDARRIYMELDEFRSRRPIDIIAKTNPILIIDEPQSVEGQVTKERLKEFNPLFTLRYSATHKEPYNMIYRLDAMEAYNKHLVKKIAVKGISASGSTGTEGYIYLEKINLSKGNPTATLEFEYKGAKSLRKIRRTVDEGYNLFENSGGLDEYKKGYTVLRIDGRDDSVEFTNGTKIYAGDVIGAVNEDHLRRIQIRETILSHLEREKALFRKGIKVLSLFFIDEVAKYKQYDDAGEAFNGEYADIFEEEYASCITNMQQEFGDEDYFNYLESITPESTHAGYFSIDKKNNRLIDSKYTNRKERTTDDIDAYDLIMKNKEQLLDLKEPVRFIFSHSALREGWDNPNVFQICTLKQSSSDVRKRQEVGRGMRLCVNQDGERMDSSVLGQDVHNINVLTVVASESYDLFARALQDEIAAMLQDRPTKVTINLFKGKTVTSDSGDSKVIDQDLAEVIYEGFIIDDYVRKGMLTKHYYEDKQNGVLRVAEEAAPYAKDIFRIVDTVYDLEAIKIDNARQSKELQLNKDKYSSKEFKELWSRINSKSVYVVNFDEEELIQKAIDALNIHLYVPPVFFHIESGSMDYIDSKDSLNSGTAMKKDKSRTTKANVAANPYVKYDLIGKITAETGLTRQTVVRILKGIEAHAFNQFATNPEEFIIRASSLINEQKASVIIEHITYNKLDESYGSNVFTDVTIRGKLGDNLMAVDKHVYDYLVYDSDNERKFAESIDKSEEVAVYVKLPRGFYIETPVGKYNPDWAIAFHEEKVKHIYFVAETKGSLDTLQLRKIEQAKIHCAKEHFRTISTKDVIYDAVDSFKTLLEKVMR